MGERYNWRQKSLGSLHLPSYVMFVRVISPCYCILIITETTDKQIYHSPYIVTYIYMVFIAFSKLKMRRTKPRTNPSHKQDPQTHELITSFISRDNMETSFT